MKQQYLKFTFIILIVLFEQLPSIAQNYAQDTVWTRKTDQADGFYKVKFSDNDSIIVGLGYNDNLFFDAQTGEEIKRISGNKEGFFFDNDQYYLRLAENKTKLEIFDLNTFKIIDSLENDGQMISKYACISNDSRFFVSSVNEGLRIWDIATRKILKTNNIGIKDNLLSWGTGHLQFTSDNNKIVVSLSQTFKNPNDPPHTIQISNIVLFDALTLDSLSICPNVGDFKLSNTNQYIAFKTGNPTYGVEVYDFNTKELIWKIPVNGPSLTGIEFSPDDKYLVTSPTISVWDIENKIKTYSYQSGSSRNIAINHDGTKILSSIGGYLFMWYARYQQTPVIDPQELLTSIFPNPSTGLVSIDFTQILPEITSIKLLGLNGVFIRELYNNILEPGPQNINLNVNDLANETYFVNVNNSQLNLVFKLVINN